MNKALEYESDEVLLDALRKNDPAAFEFLYRQYYRMVTSQVNDRGLSDADAQDIFQEVLLVLVRTIQRPDFGLTAKLSTFLFAIARNLLLKKSGKPTDMPLDDESLLRLGHQTPETDPALFEERLNTVVDCLALLDSDCCTLLMLSFFEKRSQTEIAQTMGYTEAFVKVKKHRCLNYLRKHVKQHPLFKDE
ncbi:MAG: sigma-70 family RNA polymerase sigma factor [Lewinellaceae bacterium]|nr:sigma-70 family RNA polymerase sigma factor [Lewinellaceae bacterium]